MKVTNAGYLGAPRVSIMLNTGAFSPVLFNQELYLDPKIVTGRLFEHSKPCLPQLFFPRSIFKLPPS